MKRLFNVDKCSRKEYTFLYKLYTASKDNKVHNLSKIKNIPVEFCALLSLGLKYVIPKNVNYKNVRDCIRESIRKIAWNIFYKKQDNNKELSYLEKWFIACKKDWRKINKRNGPLCPLSENIFHENVLCKNLCYRLKNSLMKVTDLLTPTINNFCNFCANNNLKVIESDKNAGVCIVNDQDYDTEVFRQLNDISTYHPTTNAHFSASMIELKDRIKCFEKKTLPTSSNKISSLVMNEDKPAMFYILPKVHKQFESFPKGRPISSTFLKCNKYVSRLLDFVLKPCISVISDLLIDTQHFLLLLNDIKLDPNKKYSLVTVDIEGLYTNLKISDCKKHCLTAFKQSNSNTELGLKLNDREFLELMSMSLDYNYVKYKEELFFQFRGIEMGNAASVMIANITVFYELIDMLNGKPEIAFYKRFLDDIFMIVDMENVNNINDWVSSTYKHAYLKFTNEFSVKTLNFLDVQVTIKNGNNIVTSLYRKPMNKHLYLQASSDHPVHLKNSLFFSQGLRLVRICSTYQDRINELFILYNKFLDRGYSSNILYPTLLKLCMYSRKTSLTPKKKLLISYLVKHNSLLLSKYVLEERVTAKPKDSVYLVFPFYKCVKQYGRAILECIKNNIDMYCDDEYNELAKQVDFYVVFSRTKNLKEALKK